MPAYNFQKQFAAAVESGKKRQTIRNSRFRPTMSGDKLYLYTGMRTKKCRLLLEAECKSVQQVMITRNGACLNGRYLYGEALRLFAEADGFASWPAMRDWFKKTHGLPFHGEVISW